MHDISTFWNCKYNARYVQAFQRKTKKGEQERQQIGNFFYRKMARDGEETKMGGAILGNQTRRKRSGGKLRNPLDAQLAGNSIWGGGGGVTWVHDSTGDDAYSLGAMDSNYVREHACTRHGNGRVFDVCRGGLAEPRIGGCVVRFR